MIPLPRSRLGLMDFKPARRPEALSMMSELLLMRGICKS